MLFRGAVLEFADGTERRGFVPGLYPNSHESDDDAVRLGRATEFVGFPPDPGTGEPGPAFGLGGRLMRCGGPDGGEIPLAEFSAVSFPPPAG